MGVLVLVAQSNLSAAWTYKYPCWALLLYWYVQDYAHFYVDLL